MNDKEINKELRSLTGSALDNFFVSDYEKAVLDLKSAEMLDPENPEILHNLTVCYARMGLHQTAIKYAQKLMEAESGYIDTSAVKKMLSFSYISVKDYGKGLALLEEILKESPEDEAALSMKGYCLEKAGSYKEAAKVYRKVLAVNPDNDSAMNSIAYLAVKSDGDRKEAMAYISAALKAKPANPAYLDTMGCILMKSGDLKRAEAAFKKALKFLPGEHEIIQNIKELEKLKKSFRQVERPDAQQKEKK